MTIVIRKVWEAEVQHQSPAVVGSPADEIARLHTALTDVFGTERVKRFVDHNYLDEIWISFQTWEEAEAAKEKVELIMDDIRGISYRVIAAHEADTSNGTGKGL